MLGQCERCQSTTRVGGRGRPQRYCSAACKQAAYRERALPRELTARQQWTRCTGKRPVMTTGRWASTTDPTTWETFAAVKCAGTGDGFGVMLGSGLGCYDLDHVTDDEARAFIATIPESVVYAERSVSGTGVHVFVLADESPGWRRTVDGLHVERYTRSRFIRVTGRRF